MAIAVTLLGFTDLRRSVPPIFFDGPFSLPVFYVLRKTEKKIYRVEVWIFCKTLGRLPFI